MAASRQTTPTNRFHKSLLVGGGMILAACSLEGVLRLAYPHLQIPSPDFLYLFNGPEISWKFVLLFFGAYLLRYGYVMRRVNRGDNRVIYAVMWVTEFALGLCLLQIGSVTSAPQHPVIATHDQVFLFSGPQLAWKFVVTFFTGLTAVVWGWGRLR